MSGRSGPLAVIYDGKNKNEFEIALFIRALTYGLPGQQFVRDCEGEDTFHNSQKDGVEGGPSTPCINEAVLAANLFSDLMDSMSATIRQTLTSDQEKEKDLRKWLLHSDSMRLWLGMRSAGKMYADGFEGRKFEASVANEKKDEKKKIGGKKRRPPGFTIMAGIKTMFTGEYVRGSWDRSGDPSDLRDDVIGVQTSLALIGSLVLTFAFPMFTTVASVSNAYLYIYAFCVALSAVLEAVCVLLAVRNIMVVSLVLPENMNVFVQLAANTLLYPTRMNFFAVLAMMGALVFFGLDLFGFVPVLIFIGVVILPMITLLLYHIADGIRALWIVQPWYDSDAEERNAAILIKTKTYPSG